MKPPIYIASCSFGKDSIATILLALEHGEPLDRVVFAEVMFDHSRGISGELPEHIEWVYSTAIPKLESMGVEEWEATANEKEKAEIYRRALRMQREGFKDGVVDEYICYMTTHRSPSLVEMKIFQDFINRKV